MWLRGEVDVHQPAVGPWGQGPPPAERPPDWAAAAGAARGCARTGKSA